jgi:hypothetical protein
MIKFFIPTKCIGPSPSHSKKDKTNVKIEGTRITNRLIAKPGIINGETFFACKTLFLFMMPPILKS